MNELTPEERASDEANELCLCGHDVSDHEEASGDLEGEVCGACTECEECKGLIDFTIEFDDLD